MQSTTMKLQVKRYFRGEECIKGTLSVNGTPFCETREACGSPSAKSVLQPGCHTCTCCSSTLSPMTLKVRCRQGKRPTLFGWHPLRQWQSGFILLGSADAGTPSEERELTRQQEIFDAFTRLVYTAFGRGEPFELEVADS